MNYVEKIVFTLIVLFSITVAKAGPLFVSDMVPATHTSSRIEGVNSTPAWFTFRKARVKITPRNELVIKIRGIEILGAYPRDSGIVDRSNRGVFATVFCNGSRYDTEGYEFGDARFTLREILPFTRTCHAPVVLLRWIFPNHRWFMSSGFDVNWL